MSFAQTLRHYVTIQQRSAGQDEVGQPVDTWTELAAVWADIRHLGGLETIKAGALTSIVSASIRMRYRDDLTSGMRVVYGPTTYEIESVLPDLARKQHVDLVCKVIA